MSAPVTAKAGYSWEHEEWYQKQTLRWQRLNKFGWQFTKWLPFPGLVGIAMARNPEIGQASTPDFVAYVSDKLSVEEMHTYLLCSCESFAAMRQDIYEVEP